MPIPEDPVERLRQAQLSRGINDEALANRLGVSRRVLQRSIYGIGCPGRGKHFRESVRTLRQMRSALGLSWDEIFPED